MVQTRSQGSANNVELTPSKQRRRRKNSGSAPSDSSLENVETVAPASVHLIKNLETITEEEEVKDDLNQDVATELDDICLKPSSDDSLKTLSPILEEREIEQGGTVKKTCDTNREEAADGKDSASKAEEPQKKHRFYFPPAKSLVSKNAITTSIDAGIEIDDVYVDVKGTQKGKSKINDLYSMPTLGTKDPQLKDSIITPDFETKHNVAMKKSLNQQRKERRKAREADAGKQWFNFKPPEMTDDIKRDLSILKMRSVLDPKRFYKNNDRKTLPKYFQIGRIIDDPSDFYSSRVPKKQQKQNLTEELLADAQFRQYQKRKYNEIQMKSKALGAKRRRVKHNKSSKHKRTNRTEATK